MPSFSCDQAIERVRGMRLLLLTERETTCRYGSVDARSSSAVPFERDVAVPQHQELRLAA